MISNESQLEQAQKALSELQRAVGLLRKEYPSKGSRSFSILAEGPLHDIQAIRREIDEYLDVVDFEFLSSPLIMRLVGKKARWGEMPASVLSAFLDSLRKSIQSIASYDYSGKISGNPTDIIRQASDIELSGFAPGSFQVGIRLPEPEQMNLVVDDQWHSAELALSELLKVASWASSDESTQTLFEEFQDAVQLRVILRAVKTLVPRRLGGIGFVEFRSVIYFDELSIKLSYDSKERIITAFNQSLSPDEETHTGEVREMDLDQGSFKLRNTDIEEQINCLFSPDLLDVASGYMGKHVRIIGKRMPKLNNIKGNFDVREIEMLRPSELE